MVPLTFEDEQQRPKGIINRNALGEVRRSKFETQVELQLRGFGMCPEYEAEEITYESIYVPDFRLTLPESKVFYVECKGYFTPEDRSKMLKVKQRNPHLDIRMMFMVDNKLNSGSQMRYADWCRKHGFPFAIKTIPMSWTVH